MRMYNPPHPGLLLRECLESVSVTEAAIHLNITRTALSRILNGKTGISAEMAIRLEEALGTIKAETWLAMQAKYDLWNAQQTRKNNISRFAFAQGNPFIPLASS